MLRPARFAIHLDSLAEAPTFKGGDSSLGIGILLLRMVRIPHATFSKRTGWTFKILSKKSADTPLLRQNTMR